MTGRGVVLHCDALVAVATGDVGVLVGLTSTAVSTFCMSLIIRLSISVVIEGGCEELMGPHKEAFVLVCFTAVEEDLFAAAVL